MTVGRRPRRTVVGTAVAAGLAVVTLAGCQPGLTLVTAPQAQESKASIEAPLLGQTGVKVNQPIVVNARDGRLATVSVTGPDGAPVDGQLSPDGTSWVSESSALAFDSTYKIKATAVDNRGVATTTTKTFSTLKPDGFVRAKVNPSQGTVIGVGMPIYIRFNHPVTDRAAVEKTITIATSTPVLGAFKWESDSEVRFRPKTFWPGNTKIRVMVGLKGIEAAPGIYGSGDTDTSYATGPSRIIRVNAQAHSMSVTENGKVVKTAPITTGKKGFETRSGIKLILSKERSRIMDAATGGTDPNSPDYYRLKVEYAMRMTWSGEFLHAAPWSVGSQGTANVSHGCVGMATDVAKWLFDRVQIGDVVIVTGTSREQNAGNGITAWNEPFDEWKAGSALGGTYTTVPLDSVPDGSSSGGTGSTGGGTPVAATSLTTS